MFEWQSFGLRITCSADVNAAETQAFQSLNEFDREKLSAARTKLVISRRLSAGLFGAFGLFTAIRHRKLTSGAFYALMATGYPMTTGHAGYSKLFKRSLFLRNSLHRL